MPALVPPSMCQTLARSQNDIAGRTGGKIARNCRLDVNTWHSCRLAAKSRRPVSICGEIQSRPTLEQNRGAESPRRIDSFGPPLKRPPPNSPEIPCALPLESHDLPLQFNLPSCA